MVKKKPKAKKGMTGMKAKGKLSPAKQAEAANAIVQKEVNDKAKKKLSKTEKLTQAAADASAELKLYKNYNNNFFLQVKEAVKYDYYVSLSSGKIEVLKLPKEELRYLTLAKEVNSTPKHFAEVMLKSLLPKSEAAIRVLEAVIKNPLSPVNLNLDEAPEGDANESPLKVANSSKMKDGEKVVCLKKICADLGVDPKLGRRILRARGEKPAGRWEWPEASVPIITEILRSGKG